MIRQFARFGALSFALALPLTACEDSTGTQNSDAEVRVVISQASGASESLAPSFASTGASAEAGPVRASDMQSINVTITHVQAIRRDTAQSTLDSVSTFVVQSGGNINLLALPTTPENALRIAHGTTDAGAYSNLRLVFADGATITFKRDVAVGSGPNAMTYKAGTAYPIRIGGEDNSEIKVPIADFTLGAGANTIALTLVVGASIKKAIANRNHIHMPPVITAKHSKEDR